MRPTKHPSIQGLHILNRSNGMPSDKHVHTGTNASTQTTPPLPAPPLARPPPKTPTPRQHPSTTLAAPLLTRTYPKTRDRDIPRCILPSTTTSLPYFPPSFFHRCNITPLPPLLNSRCTSRLPTLPLARARRNLTRDLSGRHPRFWEGERIVAGFAGSENGEDERECECC